MTQGTINRLREHGIQLAQVSAHHAGDFCIHYENTIVSIGDEPHPVYPPISAIGGGPPFHPRCVHVLTPFVERLDEEKEGTIAPDLLNRSPAELQRRYRRDSKGWSVWRPTESPRPPDGVGKASDASRRMTESDGTVHASYCVFLVRRLWSSMCIETDEHLVSRTRQGDVAAFEMIVERYRRPLVALAAARLGSVTDAEDVAQEAFVQAFFRLYQLRQPEALFAWLRRLTERLALTRLRRPREELLEPAQAADMRAAQADADVGEEDTECLLQRLPPAMRRTVTLTYLAGYTCAEAAALLGVPEGTVKSRLSRARTILKEALTMMEEEMAKGKSTDEFGQETVERLMREARRILEGGDVEAAGRQADKALELQAKELFASGDKPGFRFNEEAVRISGLMYRERRRRDCEANATQYGYRLEDLDWELEDVNVLSETLGRPVGRGQDIWGVPFSKMHISMLDARDICRRLQCSPLALYEWVLRGCPVIRCWPFVRYDLDRVKRWVSENGITEWPKEGDTDTDRPVRVILGAVYRREITPEHALRVIDGLDLP